MAFLLYVAKGDYDRAIADLEQAVRIDPKDPKAYVIRGPLYNTSAQAPQRMRRLAATLALTPAMARPLKNVAIF